MKRILLTWAAGISLLAAVATTATAESPAPVPEDPSLLAELKAYPHRIVHETFRDGRWSLVIRDADGANPVTLTRTPAESETYPHVSPDGKRICFECEEGAGDAKRRNVYMMNLDGSARTRVAQSARDACWTPDGRQIVYLKDEVDELEYTDFATKGLFVYDVSSGKTQQHVNPKLHHLYNVCCTLDGKWFVSTVHAGMGHAHGILAIEAGGLGVYNLGIPGCRPDISADGKRIAWGSGDCDLSVGDLETVDGKLKVTHIRKVANSPHGIHIYHIDWSPDGRYVAYSRGPTRKARLGTSPEVVGIQAPGWDLCVADAAKTDRYVAITRDGQSNKEPDWVPAAK